MPKFVISVLGPKGGSGKSTTSRLVATAYAEAGLSVKLADFDVRQKTAVNWVARRLEAGHKPDVPAECFNSINEILREPYSVVVCDFARKPEVSPFKIAEASDVILIPTGVWNDELRVQLSFVREFVRNGVDRSKILMVVNNRLEHAKVGAAARELISSQDIGHTQSELVGRAAYGKALDRGLALFETPYKTLNDRAFNVAREIQEFVNAKTKDNGAWAPRKTVKAP
jgi:chromosome partitioning protein